MIPVLLEKSRNLYLGFEGLQLYKQMTGKSLAKLDYENEDLEDYVPAVFHCALVHEDKELDLETTTKLIDKHLGVGGALKILPKLLQETFGDDDEDEPKNVQRAAKKKK